MPQCTLDSTRHLHPTWLFLASYAAPRSAYFVLFCPHPSASLCEGGQHQRTGKCKTEASAKPMPIDEYTAEDLLAWYRLTPYRKPGDWVFATDSARAGKMRGKQPLWLAKVMQYHIQPLVKRLGINKRVSWHTFRRTFTSLLTANNENVKVVQELLRHGSTKITLDIYAQAKMKDKRGAQQRITNRLHRPDQQVSPRKTSVPTKRRRLRRTRRV